MTQKQFSDYTIYVYMHQPEIYPLKYQKNSGDAHTPQSRKAVFNTKRSIRSGIVQRSLDFPSKQCELCLNNIQVEKVMLRRLSVSLQYTPTPLTTIPSYTLRYVRHSLGKILKFKVTTARLTIKSKLYHNNAHLHPKSMSLPSINLLYLKDSEI